MDQHDKRACLQEDGTCCDGKIALLQEQLRHERLSNQQLTTRLATERAEGRRAAVVFPFEKLPAELRNCIYKDFLVCDQVVAIWRTRLTRVIEPRSHVRVHSSSPVRSHEEYKSLLGARGSSLLRVNKLVYKETLPVLYGANSFVIRGVPAFQHFMKKIGPGETFLRDIGPESWTLTTMHTLAPCLANIKALEHFRMPSDVIKCTPRETADYILKGLSAFVELGQTEADRRHRLDIVDFKIAAFTSTKGRVQGYYHRHAAAADLCVQVRALLRARMVSSGVLHEGGV